jgi:hypothetical protein
MSARKLTVTLAAATAAAALLAPSASAQKAEKHAIEDFLALLGGNAVQGWIDPANGNVIYIDVYGKWNASRGWGLDTDVSGSVTTRPTGDGDQNVKVVLQVKNAACYGYNANDGQMHFGRNFGEINGGAAASLGDATVNMEYTTPEGPLALGPWDRISTTVKCEGELRAGSGEPDGTPGMARTTQVGLINPPSDQCPPEIDGNCFPSEKVEFKKRGN